VKPKSKKTVEAPVKHPHLPWVHPNPTNLPKPTKNPEQPSQKNTHKPKNPYETPKPEPTLCFIFSTITLKFCFVSLFCLKKTYYAPDSFPQPQFTCLTILIIYAYLSKKNYLWVPFSKLLLGEPPSSINPSEVGWKSSSIWLPFASYFSQATSCPLQLIQWEKKLYRNQWKERSWKGIFFFLVRVQ